MPELRAENTRGDTKNLEISVKMLGAEIILHNESTSLGGNL
jgi:hypothetical protein